MKTIFLVIFLISLSCLAEKQKISSAPFLGNIIWDCWHKEKNLEHNLLVISRKADDRVQVVVTKLTKKPKSKKIVVDLAAEGWEPKNLPFKIGAFKAGLIFDIDAAQTGQNLKKGTLTETGCCFNGVAKLKLPMTFMCKTDYK